MRKKCVYRRVDMFNRVWMYVNVRKGVQMCVKGYNYAQMCVNVCKCVRVCEGV